MGSALLALVALLLINGSESGSSNTRRRSPTPAPSSHPIDFDCPEEFGYYAHPTDCTQYYVCVFGGALLESCTGGLMYSHELQTCDWPRNVGCAAGTASQVQQEPESRPRQSQRIQQTQQHIPKHDLYTEEEQLGPAEEIESDRQQRVYRGQPPTIGQVASDRDAISTHSNAIPIPSGGRDKLSVVSYGNQQQYTRSKRLTRGGEITKDKSDHNFVTNTTRSRKKRHSLLRSPQDLGRDSYDGRPISWSTFQPRILYRRPQQTQNIQNAQRQNYQRSPFVPSPPVEYKFEPSDARFINPSPPPYFNTTPRQFELPKHQHTQQTTVRVPNVKQSSRYTTKSEESEEGEEYDEYEDSQESKSQESKEKSNEMPSTEGGFKPIFPNPPDSHYRESSEENPFASHDFDFDKFISQLRTQADSSPKQTSPQTTPRYTTPKYSTKQPHFYMGSNLIPSKGVQISSMYRPIASLISTTTSKPTTESDEYEDDEYYDDYDDYDNKTYLSPPKAPKAPKRLQHLDNKEDDEDSEYEDSEEYYDESEEGEEDEEESEEQSERPVTEIKSASTMTENTKLYLDPTTPKYFSTTKLIPKCTNRGRNKCQTSTTTQKTRYRSTTTTEKTLKNTETTKHNFLKTTTNPTTPLDLAARKKQRQRQNRNKSGTDGLSTKDYHDKGHTQRALTRLRASVTPQQTYIEQQTPVPSRNYTQSRYVPTQYDNPFYNIYEDEVDLYKELANGDYQYNQNNQYRNQYKEKKPQIEIVQQEPIQRGVTYSKNKYNTQSDVYQSVTPQEYDTYSIQTNDDIPYRQVQQKPSNRSEVKESESDGSERVVSAVSPGLAQEEANAKTETVTKTEDVLSRDDKIVRDFLIQVAQTPSPFKLEDSPVSLQTRGHFIVREPEVVNITPKPRNEPRKEEKRPIAIKIPDSAIDLNKYRNEPIRASDSLEWNNPERRRPSLKVPEKRPLIRFSQPEERQNDNRGSSRFQESSYELEDFTEIPNDEQNKREEFQSRQNEAARREEERRKEYELARIKQIEEAEKQAREESRQKQIEEYRRKQYAEEQEKKKEAQKLREIEEKRRKEVEEARRRDLEEKRRQEIEDARRKEIEEKRRREFEEARRRELEEKRRQEVEEARRREVEEKRRKEIEEMRKKEIQEKEEARRRQLEQMRREEEEQKQKRAEEARRKEMEERRRAEEAEKARMEAAKRELERQKQEDARRKVEQVRPDAREQTYYYQTRKASSKIPERGFRIVVDTDETITTRRPHTTDSKPPKKYLGRNSTLVNELYLNEQSTRPTPTPPFISDSTSLPPRMYTDQLRKTLDTPLPLSKTDPEKNLRVRPTTYDTQSTPGLTRGNSRHRGSHTYTIAPNEDEAPNNNNNRGTPSARGRPTLKPSTTVIAKASEYFDIYRYPAHRPSNVYPTPQVDKTAAKCRKDVCLLPDCSCGGKDIPGDLSPEETPQIVLLTFDDSVNDLNKGLYSDLFEKGRVNPNGCPIAGTFYVSHEWTDYSQVQNLYATGHEIASHSVSHSFGEQFSQKKWTKEIAGQREILAAYGGVKLEDIRGMRAPFLAVGGNKMFKMLYDSNFTYDSSMPVYENRPPSWPYTLDYKIFHDCMIPPCPSRSYPGVWEVPMVMWQDLNGGRCSMGDACSNPPTSEGVYKMLIKNFERHFTTNRSPFGLFYHAAWFTQPHHKEGFIAFLDTINKMPEVWLVTNWQAIQWVRDPTPISRLNNFAPFQCNYPDRPKKCNNPKVCNLWHKSGVRYMRTCQPCPDIYPWTGKSGVRNSRVDNEIIQE